MKQLVYDLVVFLHLVDYHDSRMKMLTAMYNNELELEPDALVNIVDSITDDLKDKKRDVALINCVDEYKERIITESNY
ncbi:MAG: hypothetical protein E7Z86_06590 [Methanosphaera stadtmanae]|nr:hypothetical protein [Methanosphaera stadtmanae]